MSREGETDREREGGTNHCLGLVQSRLSLMVSRLKIFCYSGLDQSCLFNRHQEVDFLCIRRFSFFVF